MQPHPANLLCLLLWIATPALADTEYRWPGLHINSDSFSANVRLRAQLRSTSNQPYGPGFSDDDELNESEINRARFKMGGFIGSESIVYYTEYDFPSARLLDLRLTLGAEDAPVQARIGQWKVPFNRERVDSSGNQQFVDRSLANRFFTLDRQRGGMISGRLRRGTAYDSSWSLALLEGAGRAHDGDSGGPMWLGRWDWNFLGRKLAYSQSDVDIRETAAGTLSVAVARYKGPYTAYSSTGGYQLPGFADGADDRYRVRQAVLESAWQWRGFSWQQEYHEKRVEDTATGQQTNLRGGYAQAGWLPHGFFGSMPKQLEVAVRISAVNPDRATSGNLQRETSLGINWFLSGHNNKVSFDYTWGDDEAATAYRLARLQWDFHL